MHAFRERSARRTPGHEFHVSVLKVELSLAVEPGGESWKTAPGLPPMPLKNFPKGTALFKGSDPSVVARVAPHIECQEFPQGATILKSGVASDGVVILRSGKASVVTVNVVTGVATTIETLAPGDHAGESFCAAPRRAASRARGRRAVQRAQGSRRRRRGAGVEGPDVLARALARCLAMRTIQLGVTALRAAPAANSNAARDVATPAAVKGAAPGAKAVPFVEVSEFDVSAKVLAMVPSKIILLHRLLPLRLVGQTLTIGMVCPRNAVALAELQHVLQRVDVEVVAISVDDFNQSLVRFRIEAPQRDAVRGDGVSAADRPSTRSTRSPTTRGRCGSSATRWCARSTGSSRRASRARRRTFTSSPRPRGCACASA